MRNALIALMVLTLLGGIQGLALALQEAKQDQPATEPQTIEVTVYYAVVVDKDAKDVRIGPDRRTQAEAEQDVKRWDNEHPKSLLLAVVREKTRKAPARKLTDAKEAADKVKEAKEAVDRAKEVKEKGLTAQERKLGDTLKEYTNRIKDTYENVKNLKSNLLSMTGKLSRKQFDEANKLIASYNKSRDEMGNVEKQFVAARSERLKSERMPGSWGGMSVRRLATGYVSVLDSFPPIDPLDPNAFKDKLEPEKPAGKWVVWVFKNVGGKWEKQEDQSFSSDDQKEAEKFFNEAKERDGFTATTNLPPGARPAEPTRNTTVPSNSSAFVGTWVENNRSYMRFNADGTGETGGFYPDGREQFWYSLSWEPWFDGIRYKVGRDDFSHNLSVEELRKNYDRR